jgi:hypothetical protein
MKSVKIYSIHFDRPEFIKWQYDSFKKHLSDDFEYIVINNAHENKYKELIKKECENISVKYIDSIQSILDIAGLHHAKSFNYIWKKYAIENKDSYVILMDGDCFLIKQFSVNNFMNGYVLAGPKQQRNFKYHYLTPTIIISDIYNLPDAETIDWTGIGVIEGDMEIRLDTGGGLYTYYCTHPEIKNKTKELKSSWHIKEENKNKHCLPNSILKDYKDEYNIEFFGNEFLHYCRSSNWDYQTAQHHLEKSNFIKNFIYKTINEELVANEHNFQIDNNIYFGWGQ